MPLDLAASQINIHRMRCIMFLLLFAAVGCGKERSSGSGANYEFHTGDGGQLLWRCNKVTGEAHFFFYDGDEEIHWRRVLEQGEPNPKPRSRLLSDAEVGLAPQRFAPSPEPLRRNRALGPGGEGTNVFRNPIVQEEALDDDFLSPKR